MDLNEYKHIFHSAWVEFVSRVDVLDTETQIHILFASNTYVFQFQIQRGKQSIHIENQQITIGERNYSIQHCFMKQDDQFYLYHFLSSCPFGLVQGRLQAVHFEGYVIYEYADHLQQLQTIQLQVSSDTLHMDFLTEDPGFFPMGILSNRKRKQEEEERYGHPSKLVLILK
jgi:hypothetical protein